MSNQFMSCDSSYDEAKIVLYGAPYDGTTTNRPGTRFAANMIRLESFGLETYAPRLDLDLQNASIHDAYDVDLPFGNAQKMCEIIYDKTASILKDGKLPLMIGGEHLVSLGAFQAVHEMYSDVCILHLDAHTDLRDEYMGEKLSHSTVLRRIYEYVGSQRIYQFGIRSGTKEEFDFAKKHMYQERYSVDTFSKIAEKIGNTVPIYLTIDLDVLDPALFSGTGTPEPGGITFKEFECIYPALRKLNIVGADIVELSPMLDATGVSTAVAAKVVRDIALILNEQNRTEQIL